MKWFVFQSNSNEIEVFETWTEAFERFRTLMADEYEYATRMGEWDITDLGKIYMGLITHETELFDVESEGENYGMMGVINTDGSISQVPANIADVKITHIPSKEDTE